MAKDPLVIDLIHCTHIGAWKDEYELGEQGGRKPVITEVADSKLKSLLPMLKNKEAYPYDLDPQRHVIDYTNPQGDRFILLVPTQDMSIPYEQTAMAEIAGGESEETKKLREKNKKKKKKIRKLKRQVQKLQQEEEEKSKHDSSSKEFSEVPCPKCSESFKPQKWTARNGVCPNCNKRNPKYSNRGGS